MSRERLEKMKEDEVKRAIIIVQQQMTNFAREKEKGSALYLFRRLFCGWCGWLP